MQRSFLLLLLPGLFAQLYAGAQVSEQEASLKAAFIYNFTRYVEWENNSSAADFSIGVIGNSNIEIQLYKIAEHNTVNNKRIIIRHYNTPEEISNCNILFISQKNPYSLTSILEKTGRGTLTITEEPGFAKLGAAFNFILKNDKLKFEANLKAIYSANLKVSSQLLKLAIIID